MKKTLFFLICTIMFSLLVQIQVFGDTSVENNNHQTIDGTDVVEIEIVCNIAGQGYPKPPEKSYTYLISEENIIQDIVHYINAFDLEDTMDIISGGDLPVVNINIKFKDGAINKIGFVDGNFYNEKGKQFSVDGTEYNRFLDHIYALKTSKIILPHQVSFEPSEWAEEYIDDAIRSGLLPRWFRINYDTNITRLEFCQMVSNCLNINEMQSYTNTYVSPPFTDVTDSSITYLWNNNIINGKDNTLFYPYDYITREELAAVLLRIYKCVGNSQIKEDVGVWFDDQDKVSDWALESVKVVTNLGLLVGDNNYFRPQDNLTKQDTIIVLVRLNSIEKSRQNTWGRFETT